MRSDRLVKHVGATKRKFSNSFDRPIITVIMSSFNTPQDLLNQSLESILNQTFNSFEVLLINDGGEEIKLPEKLQDQRIKIINFKKQKGLASRLNYAIKESRGKYLARMDTDDYALPRRFEEQVKYLEKHHDVSMCYTAMRRFGTKSLSPSYSNITRTKTADIKSLLFYINIVVHPSVMIRKSFLTDNNLSYNEDFIYSQDFELWNRIVKKGKIAVIPKVLQLYRIHNGQISTSKKDIQEQFFDKVLLSNLKDLALDKNNFKFIKMLRKSNDSIKLDEVKKFIDECLSNNQKIRKYDERSFKKILFTRYYIMLGKRTKHFWLFLNHYVLIYAVESLYARLRYNLSFFAVRKIYNRINEMSIKQ